MNNWIKNGGSCERLKNISADTLIVVGFEDQIIPSNNSLLLQQKIPKSELVQFEKGGHALMFQFPENLSSTINTFLT